MSLGDLYGKVSRAGSNLMASQKGRIMREAEDHKKQLEQREVDIKNRELNNKRFEHQTLVRQIDALRREITSRGFGKKDDASYKRGVMEKERRISMLESDAKRIDGDIRKLDMEVRMKRF